MKRVLIAVIGAIPLMVASACSSGSPLAVSSTPPSSQSSTPAPSGSGPGASPSPADSNPATTLRDGSRVEVAGAGGGPGNVTVTLKITAGTSGLQLQNSSTLGIQPENGSGQDPWSSPETPQFYDLSDFSATVAPPAPLQAGASVCVVQTFDDPTNPQDTDTVDSWSIIVMLGDGTTQAVTLPAGGGAGPDCNVG